MKKQYFNWPNVGVFIPCYIEDVGLVRATVREALEIDYPRELPERAIGTVFV